ncbi:suppressor of fused domain protein [[Mycobacterium] wendilense]|uniref:Suppressor of fused domain protein n=1 Tax=[Mycobacterium] wendilense TaxID=3064284 RepID=A0ABN9NZY5_9MYCO|nr:suppressor of fused domain protein [Mycolicibacterium sp. MU0050]CAJ1580753.1 suppressor of fused domain protein [Mycolicibacterium sp. MU0050]
MTAILDEVRAHVRAHFAANGLDAEPGSASVTFLGVERIEVLRFGPDNDGVLHYVSLGCSRHPMGDPSAVAADPVRGPRAEVVVSLRNTAPTPGIARTVALLAATPAVDGLVLVEDALIDLGSALWAQQPGHAPLSAVLLGPGAIAELPLPEPMDPVRFLAATPISANEAAWVRLKGVEELRGTWAQDGTDILDPARV